MIPLRDTNRSGSFPVMNWLIIAANALVFFYELGLSNSGLNNFVNSFALIPAHLQSSPSLFVVTIFTSMFMHAGWLHILSNMWVLFIFGDNVEDRMGSVPYLIFYLLGGVAAAALQTFVSPGSSVPVLGASGAIAGVLGAYLVLFPRARVLSLVPIFFIWLIEVPAIVFIGFWFITQLFSGLASIGTQAGGVAWWAHVGGFVVGLLLGPLLARRQQMDLL
jgi:membrane associated rhomboid family serine protease